MLDDHEQNEPEEFRPGEKKVEGLDIDEMWDEYPLESVFVRPSFRTAGETVRRINDDRFVLDPEFQREFVWPLEKQSKLIESCIMRIPLPVFYFAESKDGRPMVVDGLQRLHTLQRFFNGELRLQKLPNDAKGNKHPLEGKKITDLPAVYQDRVYDTQLTLYVLDAQTPTRALLDIFHRVNSGVPLSRQQMRNALYSGPATRWLREVSQSDWFLKATGRSFDQKSMRDREAVNRFCAFYLFSTKKYNGDMDLFLAQALEAMNEIGEDALSKMKQRLKFSLNLSRKLFGKHAFRKSLANDPESDRTVINMSLFEVLAVGFAKFDHASSGHAKFLKNYVVSLFDDDNFVTSISHSTNNTGRVVERFSHFEHINAVAGMSETRNSQNLDISAGEIQ